MAHTSIQPPGIRVHRAAFSLLELISVLVVLGLMGAAIGSLRSSPQLVDRLRVKQEADYLSAALRSARSTAIACGGQVHVDWYQNGDTSGFVTTVEGTTQQLQPPAHDFPPGLKAQWSKRSVTFNPDGTTDTSLSIELSRPDAVSLVELLSGSGQVTVTKKK